ncbi:MAG: YggT family protein [Burkholderiales bacterium]
MLAQALQFLLESIGNFFVLALLLRFYLQLTRAPFRNPFAQFVVALTDFAVKPLRRIVPGLAGLDLSSLLGAWLIEFVLLFAVLALSGFPLLAAGFGVIPGVAFWAAVKLAGLTLYILMGAVLIQALLSWVNPYTPLAPLLHALAEPLLRPVRRIVPMVGGVDLSPLAVLLLIQLLLMVPLALLERLAYSLIF